MRFILSLLEKNLRDEALGQLYNLQQDPGETINLYSKAPRVMAHLKSLLEESNKSG
ncbi:hypothetical protein OAL53_04840 [Akkermansiaceae bacterium]|jgi:hypothetical protein|nr:hypothetical protein [Verrucomicrobiota bacterium]MBT6168155.1 hypothetical protein [Verrucomicrobiota bacterium]MBT7216754.1 hypothetical protein [Verrucomicrobiota bacterium]MDC0321187.1 hypothetical protein [Akkermansiaceae bacterium]